MTPNRDDGHDAAPIRSIPWRRCGIVGAGLVVVLAGYSVWLVVTDAPAYRFVVRLYVDPFSLKQTLRQWGILAPVVFVALQALQVIIAPIPGDVTGILEGYLFGEWLGLLYSTIGLTLGSVAAFGVGRWLGAHYVRSLVSQETWDKMGFIIEAEGGNRGDSWEGPDRGRRPSPARGRHHDRE